MLLSLEETSTNCLRNAGCVFVYVYSFFVHLCTDFVYVYVFCVHLCTDFAHAVRLLRTYMAYLLRKLCRFCVRIRILCALSGFCVRIQLIFCTYCAYFAYIYGLSSRFSMRTVSRDPILRVTQFLLSLQMLMIHGQSQGSDLEGSVNLFVCASCSLLLDSLEDPILRVPSISLSLRAACYSPSDITSEVFCWY